MDNSQDWFTDLLEVNITSSLGSTSDFTFFDYVVNLSFLDSYVEMLGSTKYSLLDNLIIFTVKRRWSSHYYPQTLFLRLTTDWFPQVNLYFYPILLMYQYEQHSSADILHYIAPELLNSLRDNIQAYWLGRILLTNLVQSFTGVVEVIEEVHSKVPGLCMFIVSLPTWGLFFVFLLVFVIIPISNLLPLGVVRFFNQLYRYSVTNTSHFEFVLFFLTSLVLYIIMLLISANDVSEEISIFLTSYYMYLFTYLICYLVVSYAVHIFSFLTLVDYSRFSLMVIFNQFRSDVQELASLLLRFYALLFRLNVYDLLEDILDSYYLFLGDFGDEYLLNNSFFTLQAFENLSVTNTEENFSFEDTNSSL